MKTTRAFSLIEIVVILAIICLLAIILFPALSSSKARGKQADCVSNLKQLGLGFQMYSADNGGLLPENTPVGRGTNSWVAGDMKIPESSTNQTLLRQGKLFPYINQTAAYRCPADPAQTDGTPRARSYSMNGWMGSRILETSSDASGHRAFVRDNELATPGPSLLWTFMDEHEASIDDGWFLVPMDDSRPFASSPATRHQRGYVLTFADGHAETYKLRDPNSADLGSESAQISAGNSDWIRLKQVTTSR